MTREILFTSAVELQLVATTLWRSLGADQGATTASGLMPGDMPGFVVIPGETRYNSYDSGVTSVTGVQSFTIRVFFSHPQLALGTWRVTRSDHIALIEAFFNGGFAIPLVSPGDTARIDAVRLTRVEPATLARLETRSVIAAHGEYDFTLI